jgi:hypothetical protein
VELLEATEPVDKTPLAPVADEPLDWDGIESPTWLKACMMLWIKESFPPEPDWLPDT